MRQLGRRAKPRRRAGRFTQGFSADAAMFCHTNNRLSPGRRGAIEAQTSSLRHRYGYVRRHEFREQHAECIQSTIRGQATFETAPRYR
jgi:hypothetical protein